MPDTKHPKRNYFIGIVLIVVTGFLIDQSDWFTSERISAISTLVIAAFTVLLAVFTYQLRKDQKEQLQLMYEQSIRPMVGFYHTKDSISLSNSGGGPALNITVTVSDAIGIDLESLGYQFLNENMKKWMNEVPLLNNETMSLGSNQEKSAPIFDFWAYEDLLSEYISTTTDNNQDESHEDGHFNDYKADIFIEFENIEGKKYSSISHIDLKDCGYIEIQRSM